MLVLPLLAAVVCIGLADLVCSNYVANWSQPRRGAEVRVRSAQHQHPVRGDRRYLPRGARRAGRHQRVRSRPDPHDPRGDTAARPGPGHEGGPARPDRVRGVGGDLLHGVPYRSGPAVRWSPAARLAQRPWRAWPRDGRGLLHDGGRPDRLVRRRPDAGQRRRGDLRGVRALVRAAGADQRHPGRHREARYRAVSPHQSWRRAVPLAPGPRRRRRRYGHRGDRDRGLGPGPGRGRGVLAARSRRLTRRAWSSRA